ncbi:MAG: glycosyltransferase [Terriglobales bacterium]
MIVLPENLGFTGGNTAGIRHAEQAGTPYVWLLNNDAVADPGALQSLVASAEADPVIAVVGSLLFELDNPSRLQEWGGGRFSPWSGRFQAHTRRPEPGRLAYISGASALMRIAAITAVGGLDTAYFLYGEDVDLCYRLRRAGWGLAVAAGSRVLHKQWASPTPSPARDFYLNAAAVRTRRKHYGASSARFVVGLLRRSARSVLSDRWRRTGRWLWARWRAGVAYARGRPTVRSARSACERRPRRSGGGSGAAAAPP